MNIKTAQLLYILSCAYNEQAWCFIISPVYNLRISESTKRRSGEFNAHQPSLGSLTEFNSARKQHIGSQQHAIGGLGTLMYTTESSYMRADGAVGHISDSFENISHERTQSDDILLSAGYSYTLNDMIKLTTSGIIGFPTHDDTSLLQAQIGVGHMSLGGQIDGECRFEPTHLHAHHSIRAAVRLIHFFPRTVPVPHEIQVFAPATLFLLYPGDLFDIFLGYHLNMNHHALEFGYNPSFLFHADICPHIPQFHEAANYTRSSFYTFYSYRFPIHEHTSAVAIGFSYGFDNQQQPFNNTYIVTGWITWGISF